MALDTPQQAVSDLDEESLQDEVAEIVRGSERARDAMWAISAETDRSGDDSKAMELAWAAGIHRLSITREYGGLSDGRPNFQFEALAKALLNIAQGEQSCGQMVATQSLHLRGTFGAVSHTPEVVKKAIAASFAERETRLFTVLNQTGQKGAGLTMTLAPGGIHVNGRIAFATQSHGAHGHVHCLGWMPTEDGSDYVLAGGYTTLGTAGLVPNRDWDNMGQRATGSGTMTFKDVFIPDGQWHSFPPGMTFGGGAVALGALGGFPTIAVMLLGMGEAAYRAELEFLKTNVDRPIWPLFEGPRDDVLVHVRLGKHKASLAAARALVLHAARDAELADATTDQVALQVQASMARQVATQAALYVSSDLFELTGARSTASKYGMDRFWRNARTLGIHDAADVDYATIGYYEMNGEAPAILAKRMQRLIQKPATANPA
jgi:alkylation response protein AidB-like acyl-CoA dehydrogenase